MVEAVCFPNEHHWITRARHPDIRVCKWCWLVHPDDREKAEAIYKAQRAEQEPGTDPATEPIEDVIGDVGALLGGCVTLTNGKTLNQVKPYHPETRLGQFIKEVVERAVAEAKVERESFPAQPRARMRVSAAIETAGQIVDTWSEEWPEDKWINFCEDWVLNLYGGPDGRGATLHPVFDGQIHTCAVYPIL